MLFNSYTFILAFLPTAAAIFWIFGRFSRAAALRWLIFASLVFYASWRPLNVAIILPSILINYAIARGLLYLARSEEQRKLSRLLLIAGIAFNVLFLGYFKYTNFIASTLHDVFGANFVLTQIILPLGISFITFQKIAFLIDVHGRRVQSFSFQEYALFVLFFPQLVAGPIVHFREMMPQFQRASCRFDATEVAVGMTMFFIGLFKKVFFADGIAPHVTSLFEHAAQGDAVAALPAVMGAVGFTLQIYFDFSGYSDMAIGIARLFGVKLPLNFDSPLKASSIIDFWLRWHITLSRFLTAYIYNPLLLALTRRRMARGKPPLGGRKTPPGAFIALIFYPTIVTMSISGLWHGAGYTFIVWGVLHGLYLAVNHAWRLMKSKLRPAREPPGDRWSLPGFLLTFASVAVASVFFRAPDMHSAWKILKGMTGANGIGLPEALWVTPGPLASSVQHSAAAAGAWWQAHDFLMLGGWLGLLLSVALLLPNSARLLAQFEPALGVRKSPWPEERWLPRVAWSPSIKWAAATGALAVVAMLRVTGQSEFLYWKF
jgi:alginate O-acetyltransferase complex protein AlgI